MTRVTILRGGGGRLPGTAAPIVVLFPISVSSSVWGPRAGRVVLPGLILWWKLNASLVRSSVNFKASNFLFQGLYGR